MINVYMALGFAFISLVLLIQSTASAIYYWLRSDTDYIGGVVFGILGLIALLISLSVAEYNRQEYQKMYDFSDKYNIEFQKADQRDATYMWIDSNGSTCYVNISKVDPTKLVDHRCSDSEGSELVGVKD